MESLESAEERQKSEITALRSIYAEDFADSPPPKAWKNAARLHEFTIKVAHPVVDHADRIYTHLQVKLPKTYPVLACPVFAITKPTSGMSNDNLTALSHAIHTEAQRNKGSEMVFQIITFAQEWINDHIVPRIETPGSLAAEMNRRALEEKRMKTEREARELELKHEQEARQASELTAEIQADAQRQLLEKQQHTRIRHEGVPDIIDASRGETPIEIFHQEIKFGGLKFTAVKTFHPFKESVGTTYLADPVCDDINATLPLELYAIVFSSPYYSTNPGRKKLKILESEIRRLTELRHPNLLSLLAVKLVLPNSSEPPRLVILLEQRPPSSLNDVLHDCDSLREERASDYHAQILSGLNAVHVAGFVHRGINACRIGLTNQESPTQSKVVKLGKVGYYARLLDLYKSNPFGPDISTSDEIPIPESWLSKEAIESPFEYTRGRDLHCVGIVLTQMLLGWDVMTRFPDASSALQSCSISLTLRQQILLMLVPNKKNQVSCLSLLADLAQQSYPSISRTPLMQIPRIKTPMFNSFKSSPEVDYFRPSPRMSRTSRWKEDWEELELLGKGGFGSVVKARNKIDSRIYAVKKVKLQAAQSDSKIFREVNTLSRLSHRFIVRYYTTWVETVEAGSTETSDVSGSESGTEGGTSVLHSGSLFASHELSLDDVSMNRSSFPSIHFSNSFSSKAASGDDGSGSEGSDDAFGSPSTSRLHPVTVPQKRPTIARTLYIQMEFVECQTLKERLAEGVSESEAWRLFHQILDALVHMSSLGIIHRDIKLTNIFIDGKGDCKVGDFGLATSSLAAVDPSDVSPQVTDTHADMTLEVGTKLYIAPEVQSRKRGPRDHSKADLYGLGIVFFEMNHLFSTGAERIAVLNDLRKPQIIFPQSWLPHLTRQRQIISWLLQHDPADRPTALELSQSPLLPPRLEDEYFKGALDMIAKPDSPHHQALLSALFRQPPKLARSLLYDAQTEIPEHAALNETVQARLGQIFRLHGAINMEPPLLMPITTPTDDQKSAAFIDRYGDLVMLPNNLLLPFARLAARTNIKRIKRYHITNVYGSSAISGHPKATKAAVLDIISPDLTTGPLTSAAELLAIMACCLHNFPNLASVYEIHVSHSTIVEIIMRRISPGLRSAVIDIMTQTKSSVSQKRALLLKKGILRSIADELEVLSDPVECVDEVLIRLEKISSTLQESVNPHLEEIKQTIQYANLAGVTQPIFFRLFMVGSHHDHFSNGVQFEIVRRSRRFDVLAAGGRYDHVISRYSPSTLQEEPVCAVVLQIAIEKITKVLAAYQSSAVKALVKEQRSFGYWSPRRCDVYIVSYHPGYLHDRLQLAAYLWQHNISADIMYESGILDTEQESHVDSCAREGILFIVYPRARGARKDQPAFKVKSVLRGTEFEVARPELVGWLHQQITEQKRIDLSTHGASGLLEHTQGASTKDVSSPSNVQLVLPSDIKSSSDRDGTKKQRRLAKDLFLERAYDARSRLRSATQSGIPTVAVDVAVPVFELMTKSTAWLLDDEAWRGVSSMIPSSAYAYMIREAVLKKKADGHHFVLLFAVREERLQILELE